MKININVEINKEDLTTITRTILEYQREKRQEKFEGFKRDIIKILDKKFRG